jgi:hypothetical protein
MSVYDEAQIVTTAGSREALNDDAGGGREMARTVLITANQSNLGAIYVGGITIAAGRGTPLLSGDTMTFPPHEMNIYDLAGIFLDADNDGEGVSYSYVRR